LMWGLMWEFSHDGSLSPCIFCSGWTPLNVACRNKADETALLLLERGADVGAELPDQWTALHQACRYSGNPKLIKALLERGADAKALTGQNWGPLHYISRNTGNAEVSVCMYMCVCELCMCMCMCVYVYESVCVWSISLLTYTLRCFFLLTGCEITAGSRGGGKARSPRWVDCIASGAHQHPVML
jgi:hypothetical protein